MVRKRKTKESNMKIRHLGNAIVQFDEAIQNSKTETMNYIENLVRNTKPQGYIDLDDKKVRNDGGYSFDAEHFQESPSRYVNLKYDGISQEDNKFVENMELCLMNCLVEYCRLFPVAIETVRWKTNGYIIKYTKNQYIGPHSDCALPYDETNEKYLNSFPLYNTITAGIILNEDYEGGELYYRPWGIKTNPKAGSVILYPSSYSGCHEVQPIIFGERYAYLAWFGHGQLGAEENYPQIKNLKAKVGTEYLYQQNVNVGLIKEI